jgi:glucose-1-phosphate adenylyltransferase
VQIGRHAKLKRCIIDKDVEIPPGTEVGYDLEEDRKRFFVSEEGLVVIPKRTKLTAAVSRAETGTRSKLP